MGPTKKASRKMAAKHLLSLMAKKGQNVIPAKAKVSLISDLHYIRRDIFLIEIKTVS